MALQLQYNSEEIGFNFQNAYAKVINFSGNNEVVYFQVDFFADAQARLNNKRSVGTFDTKLPYTDGMTITNLYNHLKSLPEFAGSVDV